METTLVRAQPVSRFLRLRIALLVILVIAMAWALFARHGEKVSKTTIQQDDTWQATILAKAGVWSDHMGGMAGQPAPDRTARRRQPTRPRLHSAPAPLPRDPLGISTGREVDQAGEMLLKQNTPESRRDAAVLALYEGRPVPPVVIHQSPSAQEAHLWQAIQPKRPVTVSTARAFEKAVAGWKMGWYGRLLLAYLFRRAGADGPARQYREQVMAEASRLVLPMAVLFLVMLAVAAAGFILSIIGMIFWSRLQKLPSAMRAAPPLPCLEAAVLWLAAVLLGGSLFAPLFTHLDRSYWLQANVGIELILGIAGMVFLRWWLRCNGAEVQLPGHRQPGLLLKDAAWGLGGYVCLLPWTILAAIVSTRLFGQSGQAPTPVNPVVTMVAHSHDALDLVAIFLLASVLAPIFEERFFRGAIYPALRRRLPPWAAACVTGSIFAGIHPQLPVGFLPLFVLGAGFCFLYELRGSTAASVVAHSINNTIIFLLLIMATGR